MSDDTLLAHVSRRLGHGSENLATEALEYVLRHPEVSEAFQRHLRRFAGDLPEITRYRVQVGEPEDGGIRDLTGTTSNNKTHLVVEVKFDAPLTENQPTTYLASLTQLAAPALLLFLAPTSTVSRLWPRLLERCAERNMPIVQSSTVESAGTCQSVTMAVTTWERLLDDLGGIPFSQANQQVLGEITQLRGLCDREDRSGFLPFDRAFLEGDTGRHLLDLDSLLVAAVDRLRTAKKAVTSGYKWTGGQGWYGKYFGLAGRQALLHVNFTRWGSQADTPLWLRIYPGSDPRVTDALTPLRVQEPRGLFDDDGLLQIPIRLPVGGDRDECLQATIRVITNVHDLLKDVPPTPQPEGDAGDDPPPDEE